MSFWDSSVLVPLCVNEYLSQLSRQYWRRFTEHFVWDGSSVEISSAISRRSREGTIDKANQALDNTAAEFKTDPTRLYLAGFSLGGYGVWTLAAM